MRILELVLAPTIGGAHTLAGHLATDWRAEGHEVDFLALDAPSMPAESVHLEDIFGATLAIARKGQHARFPIQQVSRLLGLLQYLKGHPPDVIHAHSLVPNLYGRIAALLQMRRIPVVITLHAAAWSDYPKYLVRVAENLLSPYTSAVVAVSAEIAAEHKRVFRRRVHNVVVIPNGVALPLMDCKAQAGRAPTKFLATSRISRIKDIATMIRGFDAFATSVEDVELVVAGPFDEPGYRTEILGLHQSLVNRDKIRLIGPRVDVASLIDWADAFVHTARWEGHPLSILEAAASGLPIVAAAIPGIQACIGPNAEYFQPGSHTDLSAALIRLHYDWPAVSSRARSLAPEIQTRFAMTTCARRYLELFSRVVQRRSLDLDLLGGGVTR
jgi:L-malate glycosyltransferase